MLANITWVSGAVETAGEIMVARAGMPIHQAFNGMVNVDRADSKLRH
jgi:hypothetical protein